MSLSLMSSFYYITSFLIITVSVGFPHTCPISQSVTLVCTAPVVYLPFIRMFLYYAVNLPRHSLLACPQLDLFATMPDLQCLTLTLIRDYHVELQSTSCVLHLGLLTHRL